MKFQSYTYQMVSLLAAFTVLAFSAPPCYGSTLEILYDPDGYVYDVSSGPTVSGTCLAEGTIDTYDRAYHLRINGVYYKASILTISDRNIIGNTQTVSGLRVARKLYVPASKDGSLGNFGRWYDSLYNPTGSPITVNVEYLSNLASNEETQVTGTDDGDYFVELSDQWIATDDFSDGGGDPSLAHVVYLADADEPIDYIELRGDAYTLDNLDWRYDSVVVGPGETVAFLTFAIQENNRASSHEEAMGIVASLETGDLGGVALQGLSVSEYLNLVNIVPIAPDYLQITPAEDIISVGNEGGPFDPLSMVYTLSNTGTGSLDWAVDPNVPWLEVTPDTGSLLPGTNVPVTVSINAYANILPQGIHTGPVSFVNQTTGAVQKRYVKLMIAIRRVLVYTQYADVSAGGEYSNTIKAIDSIGGNFSITPLTDFNELSSMLPAHQILLIPEQENANLPQLFDIGIAWAPILQDFISEGGIVIQCDYGQKYGILTGANLMNITTSSNFSIQDVNVMVPDDPVVWGVPDPYTASRYSSYYYTIEGEVIVQRDGYGPVVIHKMIGRGHVVLIGHDYSESNPDQDRIVGNAVLYLPFLKDDLWVSPSQGLDFWGTKGGPFTPTSQSYTLTNVGTDPIEWTVTITEPWLSVEPSSGTLDPHDSPGGGDSQVVVVSMTADANNLPPSDYNDIITFANITSGYSEIRVVRLQVIPIPPEIYVIDDIGTPDDLNMPFGDVIVRQSSDAEEIKIMNLSPDNSLIVSGITSPQALYTVFFDDFPTTDLNGEPSPPYSLRLNGDPNGRDAVESRVVNLSGLSGLELRYWWQRTGGGEHVEEGEDLIFEYWAGTDWVELGRQFGGGPDMSNYLESVVPLPPAAYHENFRLRIRSTGYYGPYDDWFVDNVSIQPVFRLEGVPDLPVVIPPMGHIKFDVIFAPTEVKEYESVVVIISNDEDEPGVEIQLSGSGIPDFLVVDPEENFEFSGHVGGPFLPSNTPYYLTNNGPITIDWSVGMSVPWLSANPLNGSIKPGETATVFVFPNSQANTMPAGEHLGQLIFTNITTSTVRNRTVILNVQAEPKAWVSPQSFSLTIPSGEFQIESLTVGNVGEGDLEYVLKSREISFIPVSDGEPNTSSTEEINDVNVSDESEPVTALRLDIPYAEGELLVRFAPQVDACEPSVDKASMLTSILGSASVEQEYSIVPELCLIRLPEGMTVEEGIRLLSESNDVLYVEPNYEVKALSVIPDDPMFDSLWNMHNTGQTGGTADADIDAPEAWDITTIGDSEVIVAVIDTGVDYQHPDLAANMWVNEAEFDGTAGIDDDNNGYVDDIYGYDFYNYDADPIDDAGHGSHVSGTIGAVSNNGVGVAGVCWNVKIMALKFLGSGGSGWSSDAISCIQYATLKGARVMNNSWGGGGYNSALEDAIRAAGDAGVLFIASAGNGWSNDNDMFPHYPSSYDLDNVIAVLSTDYDDRLSDHSNFGITSVDIGAPGGDSGNKILSCDMDGGYTSKYGTSMAAPHVSGACALVWSVCPMLPHMEVKDLIMRTVDPLPMLAGSCVSGGRLNLHRAVLGTEAAWIDIVPDAGFISPGGVNDVNVVFDASLPIGTYEGQIIVYSNDPYTPEIIVPVTMTIEPVDYFTEQFNFEYPFDPLDPNRNDMANRTLTLMPDGSGSYYQACGIEATSFPVDPAGGTNIYLRDDDYIQIDLGGEQIDFYGISYETIYIGSNGYITFVSGDSHRLESFDNHFDLPRISALFDDLDPDSGGTVSWKQLDDRVVVTFENVPEFSLSNSNSFQVEMFYNGKLRITYLELDAGDGLAGLSDGFGWPLYFTESDLSGYYLLGDLDNDCDADFTDYAVLASYLETEGCDVGNDWCSGIDLNKDGKIDIYDFAEFCAHWLEGAGPNYH
ncbi:MAG: S8 family serine peptidase [Planctomycetota bacterium]|jgi:subtilisin family serine protease